LDVQNVDTDVITPKEHLETIKRSGLGFAAFAELRYDNADGVARGEAPQLKVCTRPRAVGRGCRADDENFGRGSSRGHALWAIKDAGARVIIVRRRLLQELLQERHVPPSHCRARRSTTSRGTLQIA
jgi:3-isopropylmalate dehydratase small subunit